MQALAETFNQELQGKRPEEVVAFFFTRFAGKTAMASSLGAEDQVLSEMIAAHAPSPKIFTLDTGRLPAQTYALLAEMQRRYPFDIDVYFPEAAAVEALVKAQGINGFYDGIDQRKACCRVRKIEPLRRALSGLEVWLTGLRREQSVTRDAMQLVEWDDTFGLIKVNPLIDWSESDVWDYLKTHDVPYNALHDRHYPSIGCAPCTRAVEPGGDVRSGRWWWENPEHKECGLHLKPKEATHAG